ncbi:MAG: 1-acyl-sn-glycerol-3-phosphate acyltransferase, partial [Ignavibacteriales bacterium]
ERREGRLQFRGPSATSGYYNAPQKTAELIRADGWLDSGDLAYIADGEVFVTGRTKDIVKRAGRNIHPGDIEAAVCGLPGVAPNGAVLFSVSDPARDIERLVMAVETALDDEPDRRKLVQSIQELAIDHLEMALDDIVLMPVGAIPRTESGKIRRPALRDAYLRGRASGEAMAPRRQLLRLEATALAGQGRRWLRKASEQLYAWRWWATLAAVGLAVWPLTLILPGLHRRWQMVHGASRLCLHLLRHKVTVTGAPPAGPVVYVANHSSYLDSLVLSAVLQGDLAFAGYKELADNWLEGPFLRRLGVLFVERFEPTGAVADANRVVKTLGGGRPLVIFPEATIMRMPGLLEFHMGAFVSAAQAGAAVVPIAMRGTRNILRHDHRWFPRRGEIEVHIGQPIQPSGRDFDAAVALKEAAREEILGHIHEPDLAEERALY